MLDSCRSGSRGKKNGELLRAIAGKFDAFVTMDRNLRHQQNLSRVPFGVIVLKARSNRLEDVVPLATATMAALKNIEKGQVIEVGI